MDLPVIYIITALPRSFNNNFLDYNYPNPFNISTLIRYYLSDNNIISLKIYDILGQEVRTIINNQENTIGWHTVEWNGLDNSGAVVSTGLYIYRLYAGNEVFSRKLIIMK
jgi:hypothetical protein